MANVFTNIRNGVTGFLKGFSETGRQEKMTLNQLVDFLNLNGTPKGRLSEATYFACLKILSESMGKLPLHLLRYTDKGGVEKARDHPLYFMLKTRPNPYMTSTTFWAAMEMNRNHYGNAYAYIASHGAPEKMSLWPMEPARVKIWWDDRRRLSDVPDIWYIYSAPDGNTYKFSSAEVLHVKTSTSFDGITGLSVSETLDATLKGAQKAQGMVNKLYDNGFVARAVVQYTGDLSDPKAKEFAAGLEKFASGMDEDVKSIIPIPPGTQLNPLNIKFTDAEFMAIRKHTALQIAAAFGIKPNQINDYEKASYASAEAQQLAFYVDTLLFILKQYEEEIACKCLTRRESAEEGLHAKFNVSVILRADQKTQIETLVRAVLGFIYTPNEAREKLDMPAMEDGDRLIGNGSTIPLDMLGAQWLKKRQEGGENST